MAPEAAPRWSRIEKLLLDRVARGVARGRFATVKEAATELLRRLKDQRARNPEQAPQLPRRNFRGAMLKVARRSRQLGRQVHARWSPRESRLLDRYASALAQGRYRDTAHAAQALKRDVARLRAQRRVPAGFFNRRSRDVILAQLWTRARRSGRALTRVPWAGPEIRVLERYVRGLAQGRYALVRDAARPCRAELDALRRRHPGAKWAAVRRTLKSVGEQLNKQARRLGVSWTGTGFLPQEEEIFERYVNAYMTGEFPTLDQAAAECLKELQQRLGRSRRARLHLRRTASPRTLKGVQSQIEIRTRALGRPKRGRRYTAREKAIALKWAQRYMAARRADGKLNVCGGRPAAGQESRLTMPRAVDAMRAELAENGFLRPAEGCRGVLEKRVHSLRRSHKTTRS